MMTEAEKTSLRVILDAQTLHSKLERYVRLRHLPDASKLTMLRDLIDSSYYGDWAIQVRLGINPRPAGVNAEAWDRLSRAEQIATSNQFLAIQEYILDSVGKVLRNDPVAVDLIRQQKEALLKTDRGLLYENPAVHHPLFTGRVPLFSLRPGPAVDAHGDYFMALRALFIELGYSRDWEWIQAPKTVETGNTAPFIEYVEWVDGTYRAIKLLADLEGSSLGRVCQVMKAFQILSEDVPRRFHGSEFTRFTDAWRFLDAFWIKALCLDLCGGCKGTITGTPDVA